MYSEQDKSQSNLEDSASIGTKFKEEKKKEEESDYHNDNNFSEKEWDPDDQSLSKASKNHIGLDRYQTGGDKKSSPYPKRPTAYRRPLLDESQYKNNEYMQRQFKLQRTSRRSVFMRKNLLVVKTFKQRIQEIWKNSVINRNNKYKLLYNYFYTTFTLIQCFYISIHISFGIDLLSLINQPTLYLFISLNLVDFFIQVNTDILVKGQEIRNRSTLLKEYIKKYYLEDFIPLILFSIYYSIGYQTKYRYILLPFLIRMRKFNSLVKHFEESSTLDVKSYNIVQLIKLLFYIIFVSHYVTCFWIYEAQSIYTDHNWMQFFKIHQYSWVEQYVRGYYFTIVTMCTVGYGDIYPINSFEIVMSIFTMLIASGIFGYSINQIGSIFNQIQEIEKRINKDIQIINKYMERKKVSSQLQYKIREYLDNFWREEMLIKTENEAAIVNMLNNSLKNDLFKETYFVTFQNSIFYEHFTSEVLTSCIQYIKEIKCIPEQMIFSKDDSFDHSIYFVESGKVDLYIPDNKQITILSTLKAGECFGTYSFFTNEDRTCFARSNGFSTILKINREDFIDVLKSHSFDYEMFCHIKDKIFLAKEFGLIYDYCFKCEANNHLVYQCPKLHYCVDKKELIFREQKAEQKRNKDFYRCILRQQGFFRRKQQIEDGFLELIDQKEDLIEEFEDQYLYGNMYEVYEEDLEEEFQKQQTINQSIKNLQGINPQQTSVQQLQSTQSSQLSAIDKNQQPPLNTSQIIRTGSRELTRRIRQRRLTSKEDSNDINHGFLSNNNKRKKSSKLSSTIVMSSQQQQALISQFQQQMFTQLQNQVQQSMNSMNVIDEEKQSPVKQQNTYYGEGQPYQRAESIRENRKTSIVQMPSEKSIQSYKQKQIAPMLASIPSSNLIISNLNNIINLLQSPNQLTGSQNQNQNSLFHVNFKNNLDQQLNQINNFQMQEDNQQIQRKDSLGHGNTSNFHNNTYYSKPIKTYSHNMEMDTMKIMKQYMIEYNYPTVIESLNRVFVNEIRKTRKSSFKSRLKSNISQHRIDIFLKNQEYKKSQTQKSVIKVKVLNKKGSLEIEDDGNTHPRQEIQRSMSMDFIQDDRASRVSRLSQVSRLDIQIPKGSNTLSVNKIQYFNQGILTPQDFSKSNDQQKKNCNLPDSSEEGSIMNVSSLYPNKAIF